MRIWSPEDIVRRWVPLVALSVVALAGCVAGSSAGPSSSPASTSASPSSSAPSESSSPPPSLRACLISDEAGWDDASFNASAYAGLTRAQSEYGLEVVALESTALADYPVRMSEAIDGGCGLVITVGYRLAEVTLAAAQEHPEIDFAILDYAGFDAAPANLKSVVFATEQAAYLAGYLAAGMSSSGTIGTYGGLPIVAVRHAMSGFYQGAQAYAQASSRPITVLGWDPDSPSGGTYAGGFDDPARGRAITETLVDGGADVILPVAGAAGLGTVAAAADTGAASVVWMDTDGCVSVPDQCPVFLTSIVKGLDVAVVDIIGQAIAGTFSADPYVGTIANGALSLAPYHDAESAIPDTLKAQVEVLRQRMASGTLPVSG